MPPGLSPDQVIHDEIDKLEHDLTTAEQTIRVGSKNTQHLRNDISDLKKLASTIAQAVKLYSDQVQLLNDQKTTIENFLIDIENGPVNHIPAADRGNFDSVISDIEKEIQTARNDYSAYIELPNPETGKTKFETVNSAFNDAKNALKTKYKEIEKLKNEPGNLMNHIAEMNALKKKIEEARANKQDNYLYFWFKELKKKFADFNITHTDASQYAETFSTLLTDFALDQTEVRTCEENLNTCTEEVALLKGKLADLVKNQITSTLKALEGS